MIFYKHNNTDNDKGNDNINVIMLYIYIYTCLSCFTSFCWTFICGRVWPRRRHLEDEMHHVVGADLLRPEARLGREESTSTASHNDNMWRYEINMDLNTSYI